MSVKLRMKRMGSKKHPFYRLVAADSRFQRDGRFLETIGYYDPMVEPHKFHVEREKAFGWLEKGAQMSDTVKSLLRKEGIVQEFNQRKVGVKSLKTPEKKEISEKQSNTDEEVSNDTKE